MLNLQRVTMFIAVVDAGSFTLAAAALGQTKAVVSFNVRQLENELGVTLLLRSTRRLRPHRRRDVVLSAWGGAAESGGKSAG